MLLTTKRVKVVLQARAGLGGSDCDVAMEVMMVTGYDQGEGGDVKFDAGFDYDLLWKW